MYRATAVILVVLLAGIAVGEEYTYRGEPRTAEWMEAAYAEFGHNMWVDRVSERNTAHRQSHIWPEGLVPYRDMGLDRLTIGRVITDNKPGLYISPANARVYKINQQAAMLSTPDGLRYVLWFTQSPAPLTVGEYAPEMEVTRSHGYGNLIEPGNREWLAAYRPFISASRAEFADALSKGYLLKRYAPRPIAPEDVTEGMTTVTLEGQLHEVVVTVIE